MAKQTGEVKIQGTIGDLIFYKSGDQYLVRRKGGKVGPKTERVANHPNYIQFRENSTEFGTASKAGKLIRFSLKSLVQNAHDGGMCNRMLTEALKVVKTDNINIKGKRTVANGKLKLLQGFEFNINHKLRMALHAPYKHDINRKSGVVSVSIPPFIPANMITAPNNTTHFTIMAGIAEINFQANRFVVDTKKSAQLSFNSLPTEEIKIELAITPASTLPLFVVLGIEFYQEVDGEVQMVENGEHNSMALVLVQG